MRALSVASPWSPAPVLYLRRTGSTMDEALRLYEAGSPGGTVVVAGYQRAGRGRRAGRVWRARAGRSLLFTVVLDRLPAMPPQRLPVLAGLALALCLERDFGLRTQVKWPNDLVCRGRKLAGVLCEARASAASRPYLVGVGLNCNQLRFPGELAGTATSLARELGRRVALAPLLESILCRLAACLEDRLWKQRLLERLEGLGKPALLRGQGSVGQVLKGIVEGIGEDGALLLRPAGAPAATAVYAGELAMPADGAELNPARGRPGPGPGARSGP